MNLEEFLKNDLKSLNIEVDETEFHILASIISGDDRDHIAELLKIDRVKVDTTIRRICRVYGKAYGIVGGRLKTRKLVPHLLFKYIKGLRSGVYNYTGDNL